MKKTKTLQITPSQYAEARKITLQAVTKAIREKNALPDVISIEKYGRFYLLTVNSVGEFTKIISN
jgi:hypothetical protein